MNHYDIDMQISILYGKNHSKMKHQKLLAKKEIKQRRKRDDFRMQKSGTKQMKLEGSIYRASKEMN
jgi:hypothetical protein